MSQARRKDVPRNLKRYYVTLLRKGEKWNEPEGGEDVAQRQLAFIRAQTEAGVYRAAGPVTDDGNIVGISILEAADLEAAKISAQQDPAVQSGRLRVEVHPVYLPSLDAVRVEY